MSEQLFTLPRVIVFDSNAALVSGAKANFFIAGTLTRQNTFTDSALTVAHQNPVIADSKGVLAPIYLDATLNYKVDLTDSLNASLPGYPVDNLTAALTADEVGRALYPQTTIESSVSVTPTDFSFPSGHVRRYGALIDGSTDDATAWGDADKVSNNSGPPIFVPRASGGMAIASGVVTSNGTSVEFEAGAFLLYTGSANEAALTLGNVTANTSQKFFRRLNVQRSSLSDWTNEGSIGIRCLNLANCEVDLFRASDFTIGFQVEGNDWGNAYNKYYLGLMLNNKIDLLVLSAETTRALGFCNENNYYGGRFTQFANANDALACWGIKLDSTRVIKSNPNSNRFWGPALELNNANRAGVCRAILINYGLYNRFIHCRDEGNDAPFMEVENDSSSNRAETTNSIVSVVQNDGTSHDNYVSPERAIIQYERTQQWQSPCLPRVSNEYDGAAQVYIPGCSQRNSTNGNQAMALTLVTVNDDYLDIPSTRGVGVMVDTTILKRFVFRQDSEASRGALVVGIAYDTDQAQLTDDNATPYVSGNGSTGFSHSTNSAGSWRTSQTTNDVFLQVSSAVHFLWIGAFGGPSSCRIRSFGLTAVDQGSLSVFQGFLDANSDPFPNDLQNYATAEPVTATAGPNYPAGKRLTKFNAAAGTEPGWICTTQGLGGTAVFKSEANVAA